MSRTVLRSLFAIILVIGSAAVVSPRQAYAAGPWYVATTGNDANDCLSPGTACATINGAINKAASGDTINVAAGTYFGTGNEVVLLNKDAMLSGGWNASFTSKSGLSTIDGEGARRGFYVFSVATIESFIIRNGTVLNTNSAGGIWNQGTLTLTNSLVDGNSEDFGGGIVNIGTLILNYSTVSRNSATTFGGGILNSGILTMNNSTVAGNSGAVGGIANSGGTLTINNSTISGNSSTGSGGGILNAGGPTGTVTLNYSTVSDNSAIQDGGGLANFSGTGAITLNNSIVAGNRGGFSNLNADCLNIQIAMISQGYNLTGDGTGCDLGGAGDVTVPPASVFSDVIDALAYNGGLTQTHAIVPAPSNPALDAIPSGTNNCGSAPFDTDQRGVTRPQGAACDIGAFELEAANPVMEVAIDIKPGDRKNRIEIEPGDDGTVQVAILSTELFNAPNDVDQSSLTFGVTGDENSLKLKGRSKSPDCQVRDVNKDQRLDLVCKFTISKTGFQPGDTQGILRGLTVGGSSIEGSDAVVIKLED